MYLALVFSPNFTELVFIHPLSCYIQHLPRLPSVPPCPYDRRDHSGIGAISGRVHSGIGAISGRVNSGSLQSRIHTHTAK